MTMNNRGQYYDDEEIIKRHKQAILKNRNSKNRHHVRRIKTKKIIKGEKDETII